MGRLFNLVSNKETFAVHQALRLFDAGQETERKHTIFSDPQSAIQRVMSDAVGPGQQWSRAATCVS